MYYLMIKTHATTGFKYLCQTRRKDPYSYLGSGTHWRLHLKKHGNNITTEIIGEYENKKLLKEAGIYYSNFYNIVESTQWANLRIEDGDGGDTSNTSGYIIGMKNRRSYVGDANPNFGKVGSWANKVGPQLNKVWYNNGLNELLTNDKPEGWLNGRLKTQCEHCNIACNTINFKRWHGDKCKRKAA